MILEYQDYDKIYVIGDVHAHSHTLKSLVKKFDLSEKSAILFLGDLINKGPDDEGVLNYIRFLKSSYHVYSLMGNHEFELINRIKHNEKYNLLKAYPDIFDSLHYSIEIGSYILVHAGVNPFTEHILDDKMSMLYIRNWDQYIQKEKLDCNYIIHDHNPITLNDFNLMRLKFPINKVLNLETGICEPIASGYGYMQALEIKSQQLYSQINIG